jgi:glycosyltransferase involved in cell wall biosynthesis
MTAVAGGGIREPGLSGGDRITIECIKRWVRCGHQIYVFIGESGLAMYRRYDIGNVNYIITSSLMFPKHTLIGFLFFGLVSLLKCLIITMKIRNLPANSVIYSASEYLPDALPAWIMKKRFKNAKWLASFYLFAPNPLKDGVYHGRHFLKGLIYYLAQKPIYKLIRKDADMVFVTNELDRWKFIDNKRLTSDKVIAVRGGVDTTIASMVPEPHKKEFDAVFIGRFHPQKGVSELIDIWRYVCTKKPNAKLAMIGDGGLQDEVKKKIMKYNLESNISLFGFKDGIEKVRIFKSSKVVLHPAIYDSGGMASCEAMACGLPGISFDLPTLRDYYPKGMIKTHCFDLRAFAENILRLLEDEKLYRKLQREALEQAKAWDWNLRAKDLLQTIHRELIKSQDDS